MKKMLLITITALLSSTGYAKTDRRYNVEVLVFETKDKAALAEDWALSPGKPSLSGAITVGEGSIATPLPDGQSALKDVKQKIQKNYHLVYHQSWQQTIPSSTTAPKIHLVGGKTYATPEGMQYHEVDGFMKFWSDGHLHIDTDLLMHKPMKMLSTQAHTAKLAEVSQRSEWQNETNARMQSFRLKGGQRVKVNEMQYIDHPMYGIIVMVTPSGA